MKIPASRRKRADATSGMHKTFIELVPGWSPYLWIGSKSSMCMGIMRDSQVKKLRDMCNEILDRRELEKVRRS